MPRWNFKDINYSEINLPAVRDNDFLFKTVAIASFIEITSSVYEENLSGFYDGDDELVSWLQDTWEVEEIQHGEALRHYVLTVWPDFDWDAAYARFRERYLPLCTTDSFQPTKARELLARMVVETGTSTYYKALARYAEDIEEPVLGEVAQNISHDEVYHFKAFSTAFNQYNEGEKNSKADIIKVLYARLKAASDEDVEIGHHSLQSGEDFATFRKGIKGFARKYYPYDMAVKMLMRPLSLNQFLEASTAATVHKALKVIGL